VLELVATASVISALLYLSSRRFRSRGSAFVFDTTGWYEDYLETGDLPCPWCQSPTRETDRACPSCARAFGSVGDLTPTG
jgi:hypothetical protein